mgnify:CR=1 FL=1
MKDLSPHKSNGTIHVFINFETLRFCLRCIVCKCWDHWWCESIFGGRSGEWEGLAPMLSKVCCARSSYLRMNQFLIRHCEIRSIMVGQSLNCYMAPYFIIWKVRWLSKSTWIHPWLVLRWSNEDRWFVFKIMKWWLRHK